MEKSLSKKEKKVFLLSSCATQFSPTERLLAFSEVQKIIPISKSRWYENMKNGEAPKPIKISRSRAVWLESEIIKFLNNRIAERNAKFQQTERK